VAARLLAARGVDADGAEDFLFPTLRRWLPDPSLLKDMTAGTERLRRAVVAGERVAILADYDVDGATGAALLTRFLASVGLATRLYIPDRITEGYGPSPAAMRTLRGEGISLVVTIDCGVNAFAAIEEARALGMDIVVVDHHQPPPQLPPALALINPNRRDEDGGFGYLAAVGVTFLLVVALNRALREAGWFASRAEPDLRRWLDIVALGTVCDMVPLIGLNRAFVRQGLAVADLQTNPGLAALAAQLHLAGAASVHRLGFVIGPRINAGGRVGEPDLGARLLITDDASEAAGLALSLDAFNRKRQGIEHAVFETALAGVLGSAVDGFVWAAGEDWHPGVLGIVASRLVEHFQKPAIVVATRGGIATASARSLPGFDLGAAVRAAGERGLLIKGGGHAMAAGFTAEAPALPALRQCFGGFFSAAVADGPAAKRLPIDGLLSLPSITPELARVIDNCGPFGSANPEPRFAFADVTIESVASVGTKVLRLLLADDGGKRQGGVVFGGARLPLVQQLQRLSRRRCHLAARLRLSSYGGRQRLELLVDDAAIPAPTPA
jgi:single-stranded-DNA-specific exonuclease